MRFVVDANIVFAILIRDGYTEELFFNHRLDLYAPEFLFEEVAKHRAKLIKKTHRTDIDEPLRRIRRRVHIVAAFTCKEYAPDPDDSAYIGLATHLHCPLWSNDKVLVNSEVKIVTTEDVARLLKVS